MVSSETSFAFTAKFAVALLILVLFALQAGAEQRPLDERSVTRTADVVFTPEGDVEGDSDQNKLAPVPEPTALILVAGAVVTLFVWRLVRGKKS